MHLGVTEAGPAFQGTIKSSVAFGHLLGQGIGDTIRVSLSAPPGRGGQGRDPDPAVAEPAPAQAEIVSCPSCGRAQVDVYTLANQVTAGLEGMEVPLRVAVMGCVANRTRPARRGQGEFSGNEQQRADGRTGCRPVGRRPERDHTGSTWCSTLSRSCTPWSSSRRIHPWPSAPRRTCGYPLPSA